MKKLFISLLLLIGLSIGTFAQRFAYVDTDYILENIPEYNDAQDILNELSARWQKEIETKYAEVEKLYRSYQAESALLPADLKKKKEEEIISKERAVKDFQQSKFGPEGELYKRRMELVQPIQEKIFNVINEIAETRNYDFILDKAGNTNILYSNPRLDLSDDVLDQLGMIVQ